MRVIIDEFRNWKNRKNKYEADKLKFYQLPAELDEIISKNYTHLSDKSTLILQLLKIVKTGNIYYVYFSIAGVAVTIIDIVSKDINLISIEPKSSIKINSSFHIEFTKVNTDNDFVQFEIVYEDQFTETNSKKYLISIEEGILKEIK